MTDQTLLDLQAMFDLWATRLLTKRRTGEFPVQTDEPVYQNQLTLLLKADLESVHTMMPAHEWRIGLQTIADTWQLDPQVLNRK